MAKKSMLEREKKRNNLSIKYFQIRKELTILLKKSKLFSQKLELSQKIQKLPRNGAFVRLRNRCWKTGRPRGFFRFFGLCRNAMRELAHDCYLPGVTKASW